MVRQIRQIVRAQADGRLELRVPELPEGTDVEVTVTVNGAENAIRQFSAGGSMAEYAELLDEVEREAMLLRERPLRVPP